MSNVRIAPRVLAEFGRAARAPRQRCIAQHRFMHSNPNGSSHNGPDTYQFLIKFVLAAGASAAVFHGIRSFRLAEVHAEAPPAPAELVIEKPRDIRGLSKEETRSAISSQHHQVIQSWENPGVYVWGSNSGRVVAPNSDEAVIKTPQRLEYFDGSLVRDLKLDRYFAAAITENGDLLQWGTGYAEDARAPTPTLTGKDLVSIETSKDRVIALGSNGKVYSVPVSREDQLAGFKPLESSWIPFWTSKAKIHYRMIEPKDLAWGERVSSISSGLENLLLLTSKGRVFSAASSSDEFPSRGEMGIPGLNWASRPPGPYDQPHEITTLRGFDIAQIATGDYHSLIVDKEGRAFAFGDNSSGQLGFDPSKESPYIDAPSLLPISRLYAGSNLQPRVTSVSAGGINSFFTVDATNVPGPKDDNTSPRTGLGRITADTWSCGQGIFGMLGTGRWTHIQGTPTKIKALSGLFEWDETKNMVIPIRLKRLSVGSTHASATMDNVTRVHAGASAKDSKNDTNWGADVVWWGGNEYYQLGMGKRNNTNVPVYINALDSVAEKERAKKKEEHRFQITPRHKVRIGGPGGRRVSVEQRVECGRMNFADVSQHNFFNLRFEINFLRKLILFWELDAVNPVQTMTPSSKRKEPPTPAAQSRKKQWRTPKKGQPIKTIPTISPGDEGIWATCDMHKEGKATAELRDLFEEYAVEMFGDDCLNLQTSDSNATVQHDADSKNDQEGNGRHPEVAEHPDPLDIEAEIANELQGMKQVRTATMDGQHQPLFQAVRVEVQCVLFFKTRKPVEPVSFVERICRDARQGKGVRRSRCVKRLTPMSRMGKANWEGLRGIARDVLEPVFHGEGGASKKFAIRPTFRNHSVMKRDDVIKEIAQIVGPNHSVDLTNYDCLILVDIYRNILGMSVVGGDYEDLKRFNLAEIYDPTPRTQNDTTGTAKIDSPIPKASENENASPVTTAPNQDAADVEKSPPTADRGTDGLQSADA